jgi:hypothetical protein
VAIPLSHVERQMEGVATPAAPSRLPWPDDNPEPAPLTGRLVGVRGRPQPVADAVAALVGTKKRPDGREWTHFSASQLKTFLTCPEQYRKKYIRQERDRWGAALVWGSADHAAVEHNLRQKIESEKDLPLSEITDAFDHAWREKVEEAGGEREVIWDDSPADTKDAAARLVEIRHREVVPLVQPVAVEEEFYLQLPGVELPILGYLDARTENQAIDWKTTGRKSSLAQKPDWRIQGLIYGVHTGLPVQFVQSVKTKTPYVDPTTARLEAPTLQEAVVLASIASRAIREIEHFTATYGPDDAWPTSAIGYGHACGWCGFKPSCWYWGR